MSRTPSAQPKREDADAEKKNTRRPHSNSWIQKMSAEWKARIAEAAAQYPHDFSGASARK